MHRSAAIRAAIHEPTARVPEAALRRAVIEAHASTCDDGQDRFVVFDHGRRQLRVEIWPVLERPGLQVLATIGPDGEAV